MDISRTPVQRSTIRRYWYVPAALALFACLAVAKGFLGDASYLVEGETLRLGTVRQGEFHVDVRANGILKVEQSHWVASDVAGRVAKVIVKAGDVVEAGAPLVELHSPQLLQDLDQSRWELQVIEAQSLAAIKTLQSQELDLSASVLSAELNYRSTKLRLEAEKELIDKGISTLSPLDYRRVEFSVQEQQQRLEIEQRRLENLRQSIKANKNAELARIEQLKNRVQRAQQQVDALLVKSPARGVVQKLSAELGQQLSIGSEVARIADHSALIAELDVQELQVQSVQLDQPVVIDTRHNKLNGRVVRVDPAVTNGMVKVSVALSDQLPPEARPDLSIEGTIRTLSLSNALYVERPASAQRFATVSLYRVDSARNQANRQPVRLGQSSADFVQVLEGLQAGDRIVVSDTSAFKEHASILIN